MLPEPTARLRFRPMVMADLDAMTEVLSAPDPYPHDRPDKTRDDAVRWIEWQARNYAEHDFRLWVVETRAAIVGSVQSTASGRFESPRGQRAQCRPAGRQP